MIKKDKIEQIVNEWLNEKSYFLTDLTVDENNHIIVEIDEKDGVWIDDCVELSKFIESHLDRDEEDFELEVGSAGIGQPFKVMQQYINHIGKEVDVMTTNHKKLTGILKDANEEGITLTVKEKVKPEGAKRAKIADIDKQFSHSELKTVAYAIRFK